VNEDPTVSDLNKKREAVFDACQKILIDEFNGSPTCHSDVAHVTKWLMFWALSRGGRLSINDAQLNLQLLNEWLQDMFKKMLSGQSTTNRYN